MNLGNYAIVMCSLLVLWSCEGVLSTCDLYLVPLPVGSFIVFIFFFLFFEWIFCFWAQKWFWTGQIRSPAKSNEVGDQPSMDELKNDCIETEPSKLKPGIRIKGLTKMYGNSKVAVKNLSLNFYEGQITAFLGHNGAGE